MPGSKRKKGNRWELRYRGKSRTVQASGARAAQRMLDQWTRELDQPSNPSSTEYLGKLVEWRLLRDRDEVGKNTWHEYWRLYEKRIGPEWDNVKMRDVRPAALATWYRGLKNGGLSPSSVRKIHSVIRKSLDEAIAEDKIAFNPAHSAKKPRLRKYEAEIPDLETVRVLLEMAEAKGEEWGAALTVSINTGVRRGELCGLRWSRIDLKKRKMTVSRAIARIPGEVYEKETKSERVRIIDLNDQATERLLAHKAWIEERAKEEGINLARDGYLFSEDIAGAEFIDPDKVTNQFKRWKKKAKVPCRLHDIRHHFASVLLDGGVDLKTVSELLGHAQTSTTANIYAHVMPGSAKAAVAVMDDFMAQPAAVSSS